jgi:hypothetical protein
MGFCFKLAARFASMKQVGFGYVILGNGSEYPDPFPTITRNPEHSRVGGGGIKECGQHEQQHPRHGGSAAEDD